MILALNSERQSQSDTKDEVRNYALKKVEKKPREAEARKQSDRLPREVLLTLGQLDGEEKVDPSVHLRDAANFTGLVLGCIGVKFCK